MGVKTNEITVEKKEENLYITKITGEVDSAIKGCGIRQRHSNDIRWLLNGEHQHHGVHP